MKNINLFVIFSAFTFFFMSCAAQQSQLSINPDSVTPGSQVTIKGEQLKLIGTPIAIGDRLPKTTLIDAGNMAEVNLRNYKGEILFLSIVPSIDTKVCEEQTHYLGEEGDKLPGTIKRITISRDTPFAQQRFAEEADLADIHYLSDYKAGDFGKSMGLLIDGPMLLARSVILVDKQGVVRYIQVVPEITNLPDMERAFAAAFKMVESP
ncbi:MAG: thiol peroxidase [Desulfocapsaceae bacterium]|nr:thiol peroxidase [Desulfocapsaceae bacterium]